jgi:uncharacterized protein involved in outer membrane biogenesis
MKTARKWIVGVAVALPLVGLLILTVVQTFPPRGWIAARASAALGRQVSIGRVDLDLIALHPRAVFHNVAVRNPDWAGPGQAIAAERVELSVAVTQLLRGHLVLPRVGVVAPHLHLVRDASGRTNWIEARHETADSEPPRLPAIRDLVIERGRVALNDEIRELDLLADFATGKSQPEQFVIESTGTLNRQDFTSRLAGASLAHVDPERPWPFEVHLEAGATRIDAAGTLDAPFDLRRLSVTLDFAGPNLAAGYSVLGLALPATPPYALSARVIRTPGHVAVDHIAGTVGDSDMRGSAALDTSGAVPFLSAQLRSNRLDLDDLGVALGAPPQTEGAETASAEQKAMARSMARRDQFLPRARLDVNRLKRLDAAVKFAANEFRTSRFPIRALRFDLVLRGGRLEVDPLVVDLENGHVAGGVEIDASKSPPVNAVDLRIKDVALGPLARSKRDGAAAQPAIEGTLEGRLKATGRGFSVHETASAADGELTLVVPSGELRRAFAEVTGIDVAETLGLMLSEDTQQTPIRCAVAHLVADNGRLEVDTMVVDTENVLITGKGSVELEPERITMEIQGHPKRPTLVRVRSGITIDGPLRDPSLGIEEENLLAHGVVGAALGALLSPVAGLLAFVDPGLAQDENCAALVAQSRREAGTSRG